AKQLQTALPAKATTEIQVIPPYATKLALGVSNETDQTIIMWNVNGLNDDRLAVVYQQLLEALVKEERRRLLVIADSDDQAAQLQRQAGQFLAEQEGVGTDSGVFTQIQEAVKQWEDVSANSKVKIENAQMPAPKAQQDEPSDESVHRQQIAFQIFRMLTHIHFVVNPKVGQLKQWLANSRLLVDLGDQPNLLLQIGAISAAIPQINRHPTGYVQNQVNGRIIDEDRELKTALKAYLEILSEWNRTVVANVKMIDQHDDDQLMRLWKKVLTRG
ncbi:accessory Sec system glycosyltransferase Asp1, partial [Lacticaseibacillus paracasei]